MTSESADLSLLKNRSILVGVSGGIAAYKTAMLVSRLVQAGADCRVIMSQAATEFVGPATFAALSGKPVATRVFDSAAFPLGAHIELSRASELLVVAPASADFLAKAAHGQADDLLTTLYLCFQGQRLFAPAMNSEMWTHPTVQRNIATLGQDGVDFVGPGDGWLSCREQGVGRMAEPDQILTTILGILDRNR